jgi:hypothetical protein
MPQLPSGQHIAIDVMPLHDMLESWHLDASRETLAGLSVKEDLLPFTRILKLVPAHQDDAPIQMLKGSETPPAQMTVRDTGKRLSDCPDGLDEWSDADRQAFRKFVADRVPVILEMQLATVKEHDAKLHKAFIKHLEEAWMKAGVHPNQEAGWDDWPENPNIDVFDQLVALLQCRDAIAASALGEVPPCNAVDRLEGFLSMASGALRWLPKAGLPARPTAQLADSLRTAVEPDAFEEDKRDWWVSQVSIECNNLFDEPALEAFLMANAPKAYGVIRLAAISKSDGVQAYSA